MTSPMIDPILSLSFALHSQHGAYALLLGSGISRSAGIPTGWEVVLDLVGRLMRAQGEEPGDPAEVQRWYESRYGEPPDYSKLLDALTSTADERSLLLRSYFEPTPDEREEGKKMPTTAHAATAQMMARGLIRVVLTTNFDRLLEQALEEQGVRPTVVTNADSVSGALPLVHSQHYVVKLHGDYLDTRIKNTPEELSMYDPKLDDLLDRILCDFGLIVCGWSAEWDTALCSALERCPSRRFSTYWAIRGTPSDRAERLIELRGAQTIDIEDADTFFGDLLERVVSLEEMARPHPLAPAVAAQTTKRYLAEPRHRIRLHDFVMGETNAACAKLSEDELSGYRKLPNGDQTVACVRHFEAATQVVVPIMAVGCYWGDDEHGPTWVECLERLACSAGERSLRSYPAWGQFRLYPCLLALYAGGVSAFARRRYATLRHLLAEAVVRNEERVEPLVLAVNSKSVMDRGVAACLRPRKNEWTPLSDHLYGTLSEPLGGLLPDEGTFRAAFDGFEYLCALVYADFDIQRGQQSWIPTGCFAWRYRNDLAFCDRPAVRHLEDDSSRAGEQSPILLSGLFGGSLERYAAARDAVERHVANLKWDR